MGAKMKRTRHIRTDLQEYTYELARLENKKISIFTCGRIALVMYRRRNRYR